METEFIEISDGKYIVVAPASLSLTVYTRVIEERERPREEISEAELSNIVSQAIWKVFDKERTPASFRLGVPEIDVLLTDARIVSARVDGSKVLNPIGFPAKKIEVGVSETLASREAFQKIQKGLPKNGEILFISEPTAVKAHLLHEESRNKNFIFANILKDKTYVCAVKENGDILPAGDFDWGLDNLLQAFHDDLLIFKESVPVVLNRYLQNDASADFLKKFKLVFNKHFSVFGKGVSAASHNAKMVKPTVFIMCDKIGSSARPFSLVGGAKFSFLPQEKAGDILKREFIQFSSNKNFNRFARQRIKWLNLN
ncbi:MAG: hypothetical protein M1586_01495 [Patescibacteria group bacterium]|nr:hypothetical protein [Patescibacteria group bacterium]MCL5261958.1 hypothetical protein [Patescibacteria group bacterium]